MTANPNSDDEMEAGAQTPALHQEIVDFFGVDIATENLVRDSADEWRPFVTVALDELYDYFEDTPEIFDHFRDEDSLRYARRGMERHWDRILLAAFDAEYYAAVDAIGSRHARIGLSSHLYASAYTRIVDSVCSQAFARPNRMDMQRMRALLKVTALDRELTMQAYYRHKLKRAADLAGDLGRLRKHISRDDSLD